MIDPNFIAPPSDVSKVETKKRLDLLPWLKDTLSPYAEGIFVAGSLSYGANYSVSPSSDIDIQIVTTPTILDSITTLELFNKSDLEHALKGFSRGLYDQFSLVAEKEGISLECHCWNTSAFIQAITYESKSTLRLRSSIETPSTDYGFSFDGKESIVDFYGQMIDGYAVSEFPSYRFIDNTYYLCRPVTNILGLPIVLTSTDTITAAIDQCWSLSVQKLNEAKASQASQTLSIVNALPSKYKMSPEAKVAVEQKTILATKLQASAM